MGDRTLSGWHERHGGCEMRDNKKNHNNPTDQDFPTVAWEDIQTVSPHRTKLLRSAPPAVVAKVNCGLMPANDAVAILQNIQAAMDAACGEG